MYHVSVALAARSSVRKTTNMTAFESEQQGSHNKQTEQQSVKQDNRKRSADRSLKSKEQIVREVVPTTNHSQSTADTAGTFDRIFTVLMTQMEQLRPLLTVENQCKKNSAQNDYINQRATQRFNGIANTAILLCIVYQLVIIAFQQSYSFTRNTLNIKVCAIVMLMLAATIFVYKYGSITRILMTWCEYHYIQNSNSSGYRTMAYTRQDDSQSDSRKRDASLPIDRLNESNPSNSPATFENEDIEDSIANDISDPCNQDKHVSWRN